MLLRLAGGVEQWVRPVHPVEAILDDERISATSPLSQADPGRDASARPSPSTARPPPGSCQILEIHDGDATTATVPPMQPADRLA